MEHDLRLRADGLYMCRRCGKEFRPDMLFGDFMMTTCQKKSLKLFPVASWRIETDAGEVLYSSDPRNVTQETDDKGKSLIDKWEQEQDEK